MQSPASEDQNASQEKHTVRSRPRLDAGVTKICYCHQELLLSPRPVIVTKIDYCHQDLLLPKLLLRLPTSGPLRDVAVRISR